MPGGCRSGGERRHGGLQFQFLSFNIHLGYEADLDLRAFWLRSIEHRHYVAVIDHDPDGSVADGDLRRIPLTDGEH
jgi:hypothetical protein